MTEEEHHLLGPYLLGGLTPEQRHTFESHLRECEQCKAELVASSAIPTLLARAPLARSAQPPSDTLAALLGAAAAQRQAVSRRQRLLTVVAAACLLAAGLATGFAARSTHVDRSTNGRSVPILASGSNHVTGVVRLVDKPWGTALTLTASGLPKRGTFTLQTLDANGRPQQSAIWSATPDGTVTVTGATAVHLGSLTSLTVSAADGTVLATVRA